MQMEHALASVSPNRLAEPKRADQIAIEGSLFNPFGVGGGFQVGHT